MTGRARFAVRRWVVGASAGALACLGLAGGVSGPAADGPGDRAPVAAPVSAAAGVLAVQEEGVRARQVAAATTAASRVQTGSTFTLSGKVRVRRGGGARVVRLMERRSSRWRPVARKRTTRYGVFTFRVRAGSVARVRVFRVDAPRARGVRALRSKPVRIRVVRPSQLPPPPPVAPSLGPYDPPELPPAGAPAPLGSATDWSWIFADQGATARWNPCATITWLYNPTGSYVGSLEDMKRAIARISGRTGLRFKYAGTTGYVHLVHPATSFPATAQLVVGWATAAQVPRLAGSVAGVAGGGATPVQGKDVTHRMVRGYVVLDKETTLGPGFAAGGNPTWGQVMSHEALHALGLGHAVGVEQVMNGTLSEHNHAFGAGDVTGMTRIGARPGCL